MWRTCFELGREVIERGVARGELLADIPPATMLATFVGPLYVRLLITDERIDAGLDGARVQRDSPSSDVGVRSGRPETNG